jgi:hypothetical protein
MKTNLAIENCYLCGGQIFQDSSTELDRHGDDHIPAKVFYPKEYRTNGKLKRNLPKAPSHQGCNGKYQKDEEYFAMILAPLVVDKSPGGRALFSDLQYQLKKYPDKTRWFSRIMRKTQYFMGRTYTGLILPQRNMAYPIDGPRIEKVIWKIARGIFFLNFKNIIPKNHWNVISVYPPGVPFPEHLKDHLLQITAAGVHEEIFVYKYGHRTEDPKEHVIIMRFWESIHFVVIFHGLDCNCERCLKKAVPEVNS